MTPEERKTLLPHYNPGDQNPRAGHLDDETTIGWWVMFGIALLVAVVCGMSASAHDIYTGWKNSHGVDCCGGRDCYMIDGAAVTCDPTGCTVILQPGDHPYVTVEKYGEGPVEIPFVGLPQWSPDGQSHVCLGGRPGDVFVRCLFVGGAS